MPVNKAHDEFYTLDLKSGWETPASCTCPETKRPSKPKL